MRSVSTDQWRRLQLVLDGALELPANEWPVYLDAACTGDDAFRRDVERLLEACGSADNFLERPPSHLAAALLAEAGDAAPTGISDRPAHARIGPYRIHGEAGRGGMGIVYVAERDDGQFRQRVALKVVPHGFVTDQAVRRFIEERQILASLSHPCIARLLDGGVTDDGLPYFAMEFIDGTPIDRWCDDQKLDVRARLRLFVDVCDAVQYAHQNLVVHRDLKPSNILVTAPDSQRGAHGVVKLLDFGVAKLLSGDPSDMDIPDPNTRTGSRWLTPRYASPEQLLGGPITTVSDVYTLGVLLYELLTGRWPYQDSPNVTHEVGRVIREVEPSKPSAVVASDARRERELRGDLDTIVLTAMQKEPARRYQSAEALADDIRRHLSGMPVRARADTIGYRTSKFVRRHRLGVMAAGALLLSLVIGAGSTAWQATLASHERDRAQQQAATTARASALLVDMFRLSDPDVNRGATISAREVLSRGARRIETDFVKDPALQTAMLREIGRVYQNLGLFDDAEPLVRRAVGTLRTGGNPAELASGLHQLGELQRSRAKYPDAEANFREALALRRAMIPPPVDDITESLRGLADVLGEQRKHDAADSLYREALAMARSAHGDKSTEAAAALYALAVSFHNRGKFADGDTLFREAIAIYGAIPSSRDPLAASARVSLATVLLFREQYAEAEPLFREALALRRTIYGNDHTLTLQVMTGLGTLLHNTSRFAEAELVLREAHDGLRRQTSDVHPDMLAAKQLLGATMVDMGRYAEGEQLYREAMDGYRKIYGSDSPNMIYSKHFLGESEISHGELDAAEAHFNEVVSDAQRLLGPVHPFVALGLRGIARVALERGRPDSAEASARRALALLGKMRPNHRYLLGVKRTLGEALTARGRYKEADSLLGGVLAIERGALPAQHVDLARTLMAYGALHVAMRDAQGAEPSLREALTIRRARLGDGHWATAVAESELGAALTALGQNDEADRLLTHASATLRAQRGINDRRSRQADVRLAALRG
ncbi:MAG: serine/threonine-protein kinase [Gemmatimonadaceae bacterium]